VLASTRNVSEIAIVGVQGWKPSVLRSAMLHAASTSGVGFRSSCKLNRLSTQEVGLTPANESRVSTREINSQTRESDTTGLCRARNTSQVSSRSSSMPKRRQFSAAGLDLVCQAMATLVTGPMDSVPNRDRQSVLTPPGATKSPFGLHLLPHTPADIGGFTAPRNEVIT
jgi:hypothetical protein